VYFRELDGKWSTRTELRQPALDLRKQDVQCRSMYSQVVQQVALRGQTTLFRRAGEISKREGGPQVLLHGLHARRVERPDWGRGGGSKRKELVVLRLSHLGVFKLVVHRDFPLKVKRVV
jgi:hypothetical protein